MEVIQTIDQMKAFSIQRRKRGVTVALVPTMGALHEGHLSLIRGAVAEGSQVVVSIFVNPTQFGQNEDFASYPRDTETDIALAAAAGAAAVFCPSAAEMYPAGFQTTIQVGEMTHHLCGASRPGHFNAVATVVTKLLQIVQPTIAYFGQKDFQQLRVIQQVVKDLNMDVLIRSSPTIREADGLAMSSRNRYLSKQERIAARALFQSLTLAKENLMKGEQDPEVIRSILGTALGQNPMVQVEYAEVSDPETLKPLVKTVDGTVLLAVAVRIGETRLIDNVLVRIR